MFLSWYEANRIIQSYTQPASYTIEGNNLYVDMGGWTASLGLREDPAKSFLREYKAAHPVTLEVPRSEMLPMPEDKVWDTGVASGASTGTSTEVALDTSNDCLLSSNAAGETWYYGVQLDEGGKGVGHALAYNPNSGMVYEINHPSNICDDGPGSSGASSGLSGTQSGRAVSIGYSYNMKTDVGTNNFWNFRCGRAQVNFSPVYVSNPQAATVFFESRIGQPWDYSFFTNNCKHYVVQGLRAGGASIINSNCVPASWNYGFTMTWYHP